MKTSPKTAKPKTPKRKRKYHLKLYVSGMTTRSTTAITNLKKVCDEHLPGQYKLEVIDIYKQPDKACTQQIIGAPTLVKELPSPVQRVIGDLSDTKRLLSRLEIQ